MAVREMSAPTVLLVALVGVLTGRYLDRESGKRMIARKRTGVKADGCPFTTLPPVWVWLNML
jgi:hypothetical protein